MSRYFYFMNNNLKNAIPHRLRARITQVLIILALVYSLIGMTPTSVLALGITFYVDNTNVSCSNAGTGLTPALPFCTIGRGATAAFFGDTVRVLAGSYPETVIPPRSGNAGNPIIFSAASGVIVTGDGTIQGSAFRIPAARSYITIDGFTVNNTTEFGIYTPANKSDVSLSTHTWHSVMYSP